MIVGLGGGVGAARFWRALLTRVPPAELTLIVNTGDDLWLHGLRICPDLDTTLYALTGRQDTERGWGLAGESWRCQDALRELIPDPAEQPWFNLGDRDLATHLFRTGRLRAGSPLSAVTAALGEALGLGVRLLPVTDDEVETHVITAAGERLHYQEFYVRRAAAADVREVVYPGVNAARPAPGVLAALSAAELVVLGPSNPCASIGPILAIPGVRATLRDRRAPVVAVSPVVTGVPLSDPGETRRAESRRALLAAAGLPHTATAAAGLVADVADVFVLDRADADQGPAIEGLGLKVVIADTLVAHPGHVRGPDGVPEVVDRILRLARHETMATDDAEEN